MRYERIRNLREDADLYQRDLAEYLHCSQVAYSRYELGARDIPTDVLIALAKFYNTSIDYLLGITDEKEPYPRKKTALQHYLYENVLGEFYRVLTGEQCSPADFRLIRRFI